MNSATVGANRLNSLGKVVNFLMGVQIVLMLVSIVSAGMLRASLPEDSVLLVDETTEQRIAQLQIIWGGSELLWILMFVITGILFLVWMARAHANLQNLGASGLRHSPVWAVVGWFIPIANLWYPFSVMRETWRASDPEFPHGEWRNAPSSPLIPLWWALWIVAGGLGYAERLASSLDTVEVQSVLALSMLGNAVTIVCAVIAMQLVKRIGARQLQKAQSLTPLPVGT